MPHKMNVPVTRIHPITTKLRHKKQENHEKKGMSSMPLDMNRHAEHRANTRHDTCRNTVLCRARIGVGV